MKVSDLIDYLGTMPQDAEIIVGCEESIIARTVMPPDVLDEEMADNISIDFEENIVVLWVSH